MRIHAYYHAAFRVPQSRRRREMPDTETARVLNPARGLLPFFVIVFAVLAILVLCPGVDLAVSGWFYRPDAGFFFSGNLFFVVLHYLATTGARILAAFIVFCAAAAVIKKRKILGIEP